MENIERMLPAESLKKFHLFIKEGDEDFKPIQVESIENLDKFLGIVAGFPDGQEPAIFPSGDGNIVIAFDTINSADVELEFEKDKIIGVVLWNKYETEIEKMDATVYSINIENVEDFAKRFHPDFPLRKEDLKDYEVDDG